MTGDDLKIISAILSIIGSGILAYRVTGILKALGFVANAHEHNLHQLLPNHTGDIVFLGKSNQHVDRAQKKTLLYIGFALFILSGVLQLIALIAY